jgi:hypothetical protein
MTYKEAVNGVLRRLREDEIGSVAENSYSKLIGDFVQDAYTLVEKAWDWVGLETNISLNTVASTSVYTLDGAGVSATVMDIYDATTKAALIEVSSAWMRRSYALETTVEGTPHYWCYKGASADDQDPTIEVYPRPNAVVTLEVAVDRSNTLLSADDEEIVIPEGPVIQLAYAIALRERGETGGQSALEQFAVAETFLADAVGYDAAKRPEKTIWEAV